MTSALRVQNGGSLAALRIEPSESSSDEAFLRRAFLDTLGTLPAPAEVRSFQADAGADKRAKLINDLLGRPEFVDYCLVDPFSSAQPACGQK